jgi:hypothetical protein
MDNSSIEEPYNTRYMEIQVLNKTYNTSVVLFYRKEATPLSQWL